MAHIIPDEDPDDPRLFIPNVEFYITNVCNLACTDCNRFNNHDFKGWQSWSDYGPVYAQWAQHVRLQKVTILGGEPLLNPTILDWIDGINMLWGKPVQILTNGTRLNQVPGLYERMVRDGPESRAPYARNWIGISLHNANDMQRCFDEIHDFLQGPVVKMGPSTPSVDLCGATHGFVDINNVFIRVWQYDSFYNAAIRQLDNGRFSLHASQPEKAHAVCGFAKYKCYHFIRGKLYKCGPVALFPEFDQQHAFDMTQEERTIMNSYQPLTADQIPARGRQFLDHIDDPIPQCRFCPEKFENKTLIAVSKKANSMSSYD